jgi:OPA family sugar phosphate sensor protein UhpC-like MFS transporter
MTRNQKSVFFSATIGYSLYYVCRLSLSVIKAPLVQEGVLTESQLGVIGSGLFYAYAVGKMVNGFCADRANINRFLTVGLLGTATVNLLLGFKPGFVAFAVLWAINGWFQSMGAPACIVGLARWFERKQRGTFYGLWSSTHNIGEGLTFIAVGMLSSHFGWRWGFWGATAAGFTGASVVFFWFKNRPPESDSQAKATTSPVRLSSEEKRRIHAAQWAALKNPVIWLIAVASAFMYVARYAINSWGMFFLELGKGCSRAEAGTIISLGAISGVAGTIASGWVCDRWFAHNRFLPALLACLLNSVSLALFLFMPGGRTWIDYASMIGFGISIGALICYLGGLLAIDSVPKEAAGAALGMVGIASYLGAGLQDLISGNLIEKFKLGSGLGARYDFTPVSVFWIGASVLSAIVVAVIWKTASAAQSSSTRQQESHGN